MSSTSENPLNEDTDQDSIESSSAQSLKAKAEIAKLSKGFSELVPPLQAIVGQLTSQGKLLSETIHEVRETNRWVKWVTISAIVTLLISVLIAVRAHVTIRRLEETEVRLIKISERLDDSIDVAKRSEFFSRNALDVAESVKKTEEKRGIISLIPDKKNPDAIKIVITPPDLDAGVGRPVVVPGRLPDNVSIEK